jgi:hypothetical protein
MGIVEVVLPGVSVLVEGVFVSVVEEVVSLFGVEVGFAESVLEGVEVGSAGVDVQQLFLNDSLPKLSSHKVNSPALPLSYGSPALTSPVSPDLGSSLVVPV